MFLQRAQKRGIKREGLWSQAISYSGKWASDGTAMFVVKDLQTRRYLLHHLNSLRGETGLRAFANLNAQELAARSALVRAAQLAGIRHV